MAKITDPDKFINITYTANNIELSGPTNDDKETIKREVLIENRTRKINQLLDGTEYIEMKLEDHEDYDQVFNPHVKIVDFYNYIQKEMREVSGIPSKYYTRFPLVYGKTSTS